MAVDAPFVFRAPAIIAALANNDVMPTLPIKPRLVNSLVPTINPPRIIWQARMGYASRANPESVRSLSSADANAWGPLDLLRVSFLQMPDNKVTDLYATDRKTAHTSKPGAISQNT